MVAALASCSVHALPWCTPGNNWCYVQFMQGRLLHMQPSFLLTGMFLL